MQILGKVIFIIILFAVADTLAMFVAHGSCFIARKTGKKVCACWDCKNKCELSKYT